ncbi:MAG: hypothetical protein COX65_10565 [Elusimicrobia bacterium CG_4_10_14_0_2_um_filter_56_8]|nr:MAG: hypothetical protein AUJ51_10020 [Elusimicrobia bacterium CG1_02_56_21]PJA11429.1 MAG: hypothetical protein COX65_10565 [Elusimicrobia bacterium CG_4_10_14_0_2_um_filter_56_8]
MFYKYLIKFDGEEEKSIEIQLDPATLSIIPKPNENPPDWALLDCGKCSICPYTSDMHKYCPVALNIAEITLAFADKASTVTVDARVITTEREYFKRTSLQTVISSAIGLYMATSGCPHMAILKPQAKYHLPFATLSETIYRSISSYLVQQYLRKNKGYEPDWELAKLIKAYEIIEILNLSMVNRLRKASTKDANYNALIILDIFAKMVPVNIASGLPKDKLMLID